ncbi:MAG: SDR family NAD(P)-dependent oxidoreductase, partial [Candidatus Riflebacteria bacterium]|nr:SDR family NAD(P)-dependent oxidoreductase [Candidatus Riflebacteria bacterium]
MLSDINTGMLETTRAEFEAAGFVAGAFPADVSKSDDVDRLVEETVKRFGRFDVLINNAGITKDGLILRMTEEQWNAVMNVNLKGTFLMSKAAGRVMLKQKSGAIVNIASVIGLMGNA